MDLSKLGPLCLEQCLKEEKNQIFQNKKERCPSKDTTSSDFKGCATPHWLTFHLVTISLDRSPGFPIFRGKKSNFRCVGCSKISAGQKSWGSKEKVWDWSTLTKTGRRTVLSLSPSPLKRAISCLFWSFILAWKTDIFSLTWKEWKMKFKNKMLFHEIHNFLRKWYSFFVI